jgi:hypothetical protein
MKITRSSRPDPAAIDFIILEDEAAERESPVAADSIETGAGLGLRWCAAAAAIATVLLLIAITLFYQRSQPIVTRTVASQGQATQNLTGCPVIAQCGDRDNVRASVPIVVEQYLPGSSQLLLDTVYDESSDTDYRSTVVLRTFDGVIVTIVASYDPRGAPVSRWNSSVPSTGPAEITLVTPGYYTSGTSLAVTAQVPAGVTVPAIALRKLAADPSLQLEP